MSSQGKVKRNGYCKLGGHQKNHKLLIQNIEQWKQKRIKSPRGKKKTNAIVQNTNLSYDKVTNATSKQASCQKGRDIL